MRKKPNAVKLDEEEQKIENNFEKTTPFSATEKTKKMAIYKEAAKNYFIAIPFLSVLNNYPNFTKCHTQ